MKNDAGDRQLLDENSFNTHPIRITNGAKLGDTVSAVDLEEACQVIILRLGQQQILKTRSCFAKTST